MELREHWKVVQKHKWFVIGFTLLVSIAALFFSFYRPEVHHVSLSFDILAVNRPETADYQYGAYYDLKAAEIFTQNVMSWMMTPAVIVDIYRTADVGYSIGSIDRFTNRFRTKQLGAQNFIVTFSDPSKGNAEKIAEAMIAVVEERSVASLVNQAGDPLFEVEGNKPVISRASLGHVTTTVVGFIVGLVLSVILVYVHRYFVGEEGQKRWL